MAKKKTGLKTKVKKGFVKVEGAGLVGPDGLPIRLRGTCLGGWLNSENFINGYPGTDHRWRAVMAETLGATRARFFFDRMLDYFVEEEDISFIASMGLNFVRVPFNYRHLEDDAKPFEYREEGFARLDRVIGWCAKHGVLVALDLHAAPGWQNPDWHSDNAGPEALLWKHPHFQERAVALWQEIARRYSDEPTVACYDLLNEPTQVTVSELNAFHRAAAKAVRKVDRNHALFLEGSLYSTSFEGFDEPFDRNLGYHTHYYAPPGFTNGPYPDAEWDAARIEREFAPRCAFAMEHERPLWVGEFGAVYWRSDHDSARVRAVDDQIAMFERMGHHWTIWTYKDVGVMGTAYLPEDSPYMELTRPVQQAKWKLAADTWGPSGSIIGPETKALEARILEGMGAAAPPSGALGGGVGRGVTAAIAEELVRAYARCFDKLSEKEVDEALQSFRLANCAIRTELRDVLARHAAPRGAAGPAS